MRGDFARWSSAPPSWIASGDSGPAVSSRVRVARNISGVPFPHNASPAARRQIIHQVFDALKGSSAIQKAQTFSLSTFSLLERAFLMERMLMSHQHASDEGERGLVVAPGETVSIMVNEEDHIRAASFRGGLELGAAWDSLAALDDELGTRVPVAFDDEFGFIAACPTNMGTGLRASVLLHLPALVLSSRLQPVLDQLPGAGLTARGLYGEGTSSMGDLIQISNTQTLGHVESAVIRNVEKSVRHIIALETKATLELVDGSLRTAVEDRVHRAIGTLLSARLLEYGEGARCLSLGRLGIRLGLDLGVTSRALNELLFLTQPAHLRMQSGKEGEKTPEAELRAAIVREKLSR